MRKSAESQGKSAKKTGVGILIGIPLLLFICGITLISIGTYKHLKYIVFLSRIILKDDVNHGDSQKYGIIDGKDVPPINKIKFPKYGEKYGELIIESASIDYPVYFGDSEDQLLKGIGHYNGSKFPGEDGNILLAGHRNSVFRNMRKVSKGDSVIFKTTYGDYTYKVSDIIIISGKDQSIAQPTEKERLTIYTCYPFNYIGSAPKRYVLLCDLVQGTPLKELVLEEGQSNEDAKLYN